MHVFELKVPPVALTVIFAVVMWGVSRFFSTAFLPVPGGSIVAFAFAIVGGGIAVAGVYEFRRHDTTVHPMKPETTVSIVTDGIYRFTRNPMYLGLVLVLMGWATFLSNLAAALLVPAFVAYMTRFQIQPEERALLEKFGPGFAEYMAAVRRWI